MTYNNMVLVGNWSEERLKNERPLAISGTFALFGYNVQLVASDMPAKTCGGKPQYGLALSSLVKERQVDFMENINDGCLMTLSAITTPCCRNTFVILSFVYQGSPVICSLHNGGSARAGRYDANSTEFYKGFQLSMDYDAIASKRPTRRAWKPH
ncbi:unnamed protein product [Pieris brassicae]|uniref:Uncharacterized protein n=1 Tax=Pieris brassicae TaxID=7116 RepID=A0A9P0TM94_PIEBR|nr:unnamed protein product [Pieris brassicae]